MSNKKDTGPMSFFLDDHRNHGSVTCMHFGPHPTGRIGGRIGTRTATRRREIQLVISVAHALRRANAGSPRFFSGEATLAELRAAVALVARRLLCRAAASRAIMPSAVTELTTGAADESTASDDEG